MVDWSSVRTGLADESSGALAFILDRRGRHPGGGHARAYIQLPTSGAH